MNDHSFIPKSKNYKSLLSYQKAVIIYDCTVIFCERFFRKSDRTVDQMTQAARSGKQNIVEGCMAAKISAETEIKLTGVARASLQELLEDYEDFIRVRNYRFWEKNGKEASYVRKLSSGKIKPPEIYDDISAPKDISESFEKIYRVFIFFIKNRSPEICANIMICLVNQCNYLLDRQIAKLENEFVKEGGLREKMFTARLKYRKQMREEK